jgi:GNAT superfamily N-acetyltransferase
MSLTADDFRALALSLPETTAGFHMGHADFRVRSKIFASLNEAETEGNVKLEPGRREALAAAHPGCLSAHRGAWGAQGWTRLDLACAAPALVHEALHVSWRLVAPPKLTRGAPEAPVTPAVGFRNGRADELADVLSLDEDASLAYEPHGLVVLLARDHPFSLDEERRWGADLQAGRLLFACIDGDDQAGFIAFHTVDGAPYLDQISVRRRHARQGIGRRLLRRAQVWAAPHGSLWLTTYAGLAFNEFFYAAHGFEVVPESACGPGIRAILDSQRAALPAPERRIAMRWRPMVPR